jgi:hypothetical protein
MWERKREIKATFKWERKCYELDQYSSQLLLHLLFKFMLMWDGNIPLPPLLMLWGVTANPKLYTQLYKVAWRRWRWPWWWWSKVSWPKEDSRTFAGSCKHQAFDPVNAFGPSAFRFWSFHPLGYFDCPAGKKDIIVGEQEGRRREAEAWTTSGGEFWWVGDVFCRRLGSQASQTQASLSAAPIIFCPQLILGLSKC